MTKGLPRELRTRLLSVPGAVRTQLLELPVRLLPLDASGAPGGALAAEQRRAALGELEVDEDRDGEEPVKDVAQDRADCGSFAVRVPSTSGERVRVIAPRYFMRPGQTQSVQASKRPSTIKRNKNKNKTKRSAIALRA